MGGGDVKHKGTKYFYRTPPDRNKIPPEWSENSGYVYGLFCC